MDEKIKGMLYSIGIFLWSFLVTPVFNDGKNLALQTVAE